MGASFISGTLLMAVGIVTVKKNQNLQYILFAAIPLIFAVQQLTEGFIWLALQNKNYANLLKPFAYLFSVFSQIVWPAWIPLSILILEKKSGRNIILSILSILGLFVSVSLGYHLIKYGVIAEIREHHIDYDFRNSLGMPPFISIFYVIVILVPPFVCSLKIMWSLGLAVLVSFIITTLLYENYLISVWCFFAAVISVVVYFILREIRRSNVDLVTVFKTNEKNESLAS